MSRILVPLVLLSLFLGSAWATPPDDDAGARAERHSKRGVTFYRQGKLADAVREMLEAYKAVPDPALLFNIARIYEKLGEDQIAIGYYQQFVTNAGAEPTRVQKAIEYMQALREKAKAAVVPTPVPAPVAPPPPAVSAPPPATVVAPSAETAPQVSSTPAMVGVEGGLETGSSVAWIGPVLLGATGTGLLAGGLVFAARAKQAEKDIESYDLSYDVRLKAQSDGRADTLSGDILMLSGGISLVGALLWYSLSDESLPPEAPKSGLVAGLWDDGVFIGVSGVFP